MKIDVLNINFELPDHLKSIPVDPAYSEEINIKDLNSLFCKLKEDSQKLTKSISLGTQTFKNIESVKRLAGIFLVSIYNHSNKQLTLEFQDYKNKISELMQVLCQNAPKLEAKEIDLVNNKDLYVSDDLSLLEQRILSLPFFEYLNDLNEVNPSSTPPLTNKKILENITHAIASITNMPKKIDLLRQVLDTGDWNNSDFDCSLENASIRAQNSTWDYEMPYVGIFAFVENLITEEEFCQLLMYFSLRHEYSKKDIEIVKPSVLCGSNENCVRWEEVLRQTAQSRPFPSIQNLNEDEFILLKTNIEKQCRDNPGRMVFFSILTPMHEEPTPMSMGLTHTGFKFFYGPNVKSCFHRIAAPLIFYQEALKLLFPESYMTLIAKCGFTPIEEQYRRRSNKQNHGEIDVAYPCPGICEPYLKNNTQKNLMADGYCVPGCDLMFHDLYHAFIASGLPVEYRDYLLDLGKKIVEDKELWEKLKNETDHWMLDFSVKEIQRESNLAFYIRGKIFDLEHPAKMFLDSAYYNRSRVPIQPPENMEYAIDQYRVDFFGCFLNSIKCLDDVPWADNR